MEQNCNQCEEETKEILAFDTLYTTNHMKILKILLPYLECDYQKKLAVYIKWQELLFTIGHMKKFSSPLYCKCCTTKKEPDFALLAQILSPYCSEQERKLLSHFSQIKNYTSLFSQIQEYLPLLQGMMSSEGGEFNPMDLMETMLSEEQKAMFQMFMDNQ